jgi:hypothetical protein
MLENNPSLNTEKNITIVLKTRLTAKNLNHGNKRINRKRKEKR